jgi:hypothetical protein
VFSTATEGEGRCKTRRRDFGAAQRRGGRKNTAERAMLVPDGPVYHIRDTLKQ